MRTMTMSSSCSCADSFLGESVCVGISRAAFSVFFYYFFYFYCIKNSIWYTCTFPPLFLYSVGRSTEMARLVLLLKKEDQKCGCKTVMFTNWSISQTYVKAIDLWGPRTRLD